MSKLVPLGLVSVLTGLTLLAVSPPGWIWWPVLGVYLVGVVALFRQRAWLIENRSAGITAIALCGLASLTGLLVATRQHLLWQALMAALAGALVASLALLMASDMLNLRLRGPSRRYGVAATVVLLGGLALGLWGMIGGGRPLAAEGVLGFTLGVVMLNVWLGKFGVVKPELMVVLGAAILVQSVVFFLCGRGLDVCTFFGLLFWVAGLTVFKLALGPWIGTDRKRIRAVSFTSFGAIVLGVLSIAVGGGRSNQLGVVGGITLTVVGLSAIGISIVRTPVSKRFSLVISATGFVLLVFGLLAAQHALRVWGITFIVSATVALVGAWFVFRGEGLVAVVLLGFVVLWGLADRTAPVAHDPNPTGAGRILALGDSYISGEGAPRYLPGTNNVGDGRNECRRAPTAYPYLLATSLDMGLDFFACSGAKTIDVLSRAQMPDTAPDVIGGLPQLANLDSFSQAQLDAIDVVLISIGGNDVGFSTIVQACLLPRNCNERQDEWFANVELLGPQLETTYAAVRERLPDTPIYAMPYPRVIGSDACGLGLQQREHEFVNEFITKLDVQIAIAAAQAGVHYFEPSVRAFARHELCSQDPATNHLHLSPPQGDWLGRYSPGLWIHGSMHPRPTGHALIADLLADEVAAQLARVAAGEPANPLPPATTDGAEIGTTVTAEEQEQADEAQERLTDDQWISDELYRTVQAALVPVLALLVGGVVLATGLVLLNHRSVRSLSPMLDSATPRDVQAQKAS